MSRLLLALGALVAVTIFAAGVSTLWPSAKAGDDDTNAPTGRTPQAPANEGPPAIEEPPRAILRTSDGRELVGGAGTRCWNGMCVDMTGPISNADPFAVHRGGPLVIDFEAGMPNSTSSAWRKIDGPPGRITENGKRVWSGPSYFHLGPDVTPPVSLAAPSEPGDYLYVVQAFFTGRGDVVYAFYLSVE